MTKHDEARRAFLVGAGATVAGAGLPSNAEAQHHNRNRRGNDDSKPQTQTPAHGGLGAFLNIDDAATVEAFTERLMPGAPGKPGARDAGVLNYIDLALAGAYADLQDFYRRGLKSLDAHCQVTYQKGFTQLSAAQQDEVITAMETNKATGFTWPSAPAFFNTLRTHTMEGMFADPIYGGNKDFAGWRLVGFPGAQAAFTEADMKSKQPFTRAPIVGLQGMAKTPSRRG